MFGQMAPNSLPAMLSRQMAPGMIPGPVPGQQLTPGFRAAGGGVGPSAAQPQQTPGMGMDPNMLAMMAMAMRHKPGDARTTGDADLSGYGKNPSMTPGEDANGNPIMLPNPNQPGGGDWFARMMQSFGGSGGGSSAGLFGSPMSNSGV